MLELAEYEAMRQRPDGRLVMRQRWRSLLFLHFEVDPAEIQALLPNGLTVDTFPDSAGVQKAWVGLVPFRMEGVTPIGVPEIPGIHAFPETNVRTYVHREGHGPGVWFFSLDAGNFLACRVARRFFHLPYFEARMSVVEGDRRVDYSGHRLSGKASYEISCETGEDSAAPLPGSLEFFLLERYLLFSVRQGKFFTGRVHHKPYTARSAIATSVRENLVAAAGIVPRPFTHTLFSPGVDVDIFGLQSVRP